ncbi:MAG: phosphatase PAP2 family protein [Candidatus Sumerlaeaceae bacterium]
MNEFLYDLGESLQNFGTGGYLIVSLIVLLETAVVIGQFVPGTFFLAFVGFLCFAQVFDFSSMLLSIFVTHYLGEIGNYTLGRTKGRAIFQADSRFFRPRFLNAAEARFKKSGAKILVFGQFIGLLRPFFSLAAGATHYPLVRFLPFMAIGAFLWSLVPLTIGFLAGASWEKAVKYLENFSLVLLVGIPLALFAAWVIKRIVGYSADIGSLIERSSKNVRTSERYQRLATRHPAMFGFFENRLSLSRPWGLKASMLLLGAGCCFTFALMILADIKTNDNWKFFDLAAVNLLAQLRTPVADTVFLYITHLGSAAVVLAILAIACALCLHARQQKSCVVIAASVLLGIMFSQMLKFGYGRERPDITVRIIDAAGFSFPSGHSTVAISLFGALYYWLWNHPGKLRLRVGLAFTLLLLAFLVGFSRMYLGVHYPSDVTAGFALGSSAALLAVAIGTNAPRLIDIPRRADIAMLALLLIHFGAAVLYARIHPTRPPATFVESKRMKRVNTLDEVLTRLPREVRSLASERLLPVNIVALGPITSVTAELHKQGWRRNAPTDFFTRRIASPVFPAFVDSKPAEVAMEKGTSSTRLIARFWPVDFMVTSAPVYLGSVSEESLQKKFRSLQVYRISHDVDLARDAFAKELPQLAPTLLEGFRPRGLYQWKYPFFTLGGALSLDLTTTASGSNRIDRSNPPDSQS